MSNPKCTNCEHSRFAQTEAEAEKLGEAFEAQTDRMVPVTVTWFFGLIKTDRIRMEPEDVDVWARLSRRTEYEYAVGGRCHRYPESKQITHTEFCGEYKASS